MASFIGGYNALPFNFTQYNEVVVTSSYGGGTIETGDYGLDHIPGTDYYQPEVYKAPDSYIKQELV